MGFRGAGKSLYGVALACALSKRFRLPILANIGVNYPGARRLVSIEDFASATGAVCLMDEAHRNLDARLWADNKQFTDVLLYNRKRMKHVIYTTPHVRNIDVRIREIVPLLVVIDRPPVGESITARWYDVERAGGIDHIGEPFRADLVPDKRRFYGLYNTMEEAPILPVRVGEVRSVPGVGARVVPARPAPLRPSRP